MKGNGEDDLSAAHLKWKWSLFENKLFIHDFARESSKKQKKKWAIISGSNIKTVNDVIKSMLGLNWIYSPLADTITHFAQPTS